MERTITFVFLCTVAKGQIGKHFLISTAMTWPDAQAYCRQHYTDLSFVFSQSDQDKLIEAAGYNCREGWIGLHRRPDNITAWMWSGGVDVTYQNWLEGQPDDNGKYAGRVFFNGKWKDGYENYSMPFYCISTPIVKVKMSWEEALEYCRNIQTDLPSLLSEADLNNTQRVIQFDYVTEPVWIGLRYLDDDWMWLNGKPLVYNAWPQGDQDHLCPIQRRCGALTKTEGWKSQDCQDRLYFLCI